MYTYGDLRDGCTSAGGHLNPVTKNHGNRTDKERHVGDLGNIKSDENGNAKIIFKDSYIDEKQ